MQNDALLNVESKEVRYAHLKNGELDELIIERKKSRILAGNIYRGRVTNILRNIQSAFIDINEGESGFIHLSDIIENTKKFEQLFDMDFELDEEHVDSSKSKKKELGIEELLKIDQPVIVQIVKEPIGSKGARLTSNIALAGRYLVLLPNSPHRGVSRKIEDKATREKLKKHIRSFEMPHDMGLILRTAAVHASTEMLVDEASELIGTWKETVDKFNQSSEPTLLFEESDIVTRTLLTCVDKKFDRLLIDDYSVYQKARRLYQRYSHEHPLRIEYYRDKTPIFERFNVEREIDKATRRKIWLSSGGYLFFDRTEAMYTIDVNSGRGSGSNSDIEESLVRINLEAAEEIARQLRLRNIGGLVIIDFIDMRLRKNQRRVFEKLKECMKSDSAKCTVLSMSEFGLVELTRQRSRESLVQMLFTQCPYCSGSGLVKNFETMAIEMERALKKAIFCLEQFGLCFVIHPDLEKYLYQEGEKEFLLDYAEKNNANLEFKTSDLMHINDFKLYSTITGESLIA